MLRTWLRNCYLKKRPEQKRFSYVKQRNYVSLLKKKKKPNKQTNKTEKIFYANFNVKDIADNTQFWRTVKPLFSDKTKSNEKITLVEDETVATQDEKSAELLNLFFSSVVENLKIPEFSDTNPLAEKFSKSTLKAILKYKNHQNIVVIRNANNDSHFLFNEVSAEEVYKKIRELSPRKSHIPIRVVKENDDIFADYISGFLNFQ